MDAWTIIVGVGVGIAASVLVSLLLVALLRRIPQDAAPPDMSVYPTWETRNTPVFYRDADGQEFLEAEWRRLS